MLLRIGIPRGMGKVDADVRQPEREHRREAGKGTDKSSIEGGKFMGVAYLWSFRRGRKVWWTFDGNIDALGRVHCAAPALRPISR